jgi:VWFA-related protein
MRHGIKFLSLLVTLLVYSLTLSAQSQDVEKVEIRRVRLPVTVFDKKGQPVAGLKSNDFLIYEDKKLQSIESFDDEKSQAQPLHIGVLMDTSPSAISKLKFEQEAAMNFLYTVMRVRKDRAAIVTFDNEIKLLQDFTEKLELLNRAISSPKKAGTHTALFDAVWQFCKEKLRTAPGRRAIVVITDGDDTYSRANLRDAIDMAQQTETLIFAISTKGGFSGTVPGVEAGQAADSGDKDLMKLCEETGGRAFFTGDSTALEEAFNRLANELRSQYVVTYKSTNERYDGQFRRIEVKLSESRDGMKVRTRRGYSAIASSPR